MLENQVGHGRAHRDFVHSRPHHVAAHANKFQPGGAARALRLVPIHAAHKNRGTFANVSTLLMTVGLFHSPCLHGKWRLVSRLGALAFNRFEQRRFFAADVAAGADKYLQIESQSSLPRMLDPSSPASLQRSSSSSRILSCSSYSWRIYRMPLLAPVSTLARIIPSITRCGRCVRM